jgi:spermidine/putrescine transport system permease protein
MPGVMLALAENKLLIQLLLALVVGGGLFVQWRRKKLLATGAFAALAYLFVPILVIVVFSFNRPGKYVTIQGVRQFKDPARLQNYSWGKFSLDAWMDPFKYPEMRDAFWLSLRVAFAATLLAVILGTAMSLALVKYRFTGKGLINMLLVLPLTMPEIVLGFSLLTLFINSGVNRGILTIIIAHVMFCVSYVATTVKARIRGFDWRLEEAAADLGATPWRTFTRVTLPIIAPGVAAAGLLTFALSLDDFIITVLNSGSQETFPIWVWVKKRSIVPPQINVIGSMVLLVSVALSIGGLLLQRRRAKLT